MDIHYNAFISYRHHPDDIRAATQIHRALERFHVPKPIRGKAKLPLRLFRDKDELPITANLSDDIFDALRNSDFLIVICSVHTRESAWVQREIETFLKTHHRSRVLTVLVNGEPYDVIPEILLYEDVTDPETGETRRIPYEPLSCDWRMGYRKAVQEELPRLAAPLLHCSYDELRQRQRQYRMKRMVTGFSLALAASLSLAVYFLYTSITIHNANIQIQKNLDASLANQSRHLATASEERLEAKDRFTAISLALQALPENKDRPYVASAEYALMKALDVYTSGNTLAAIGTMVPSTSATVTDFVVAENRKAVYLHDSRNIITAWNPETLQKTGTMDLAGQSATDFSTTPAGNLLARVGSSLQCFSPAGTMLWNTEGMQDYAFLDDKTQLMVSLWDSNEKRGTILFLAPDSGKPVRDALALTEIQDGLSFGTKEQTSALPVVLHRRGFDQALYLLDLQTGGVIPFLSTEENIRYVTVLESGQVISLVSDGSGRWNGDYGNQFITSPERNLVFCHDAATGRLLWESEITTYLYTAVRSCYAIPGTGKLLCQSGNTLQIMDGRTGAILQRCETAAGVEVLEVYDTFTTGILEDGSLLHYSYEDNECSALDYNMEGSLRQASMHSGFFTLQMRSPQVTAYKYIEPTYLWQADFDGEMNTTQLRIRGNLMACRDSETISVYDLNNRSRIYALPVPGGKILDFSQDGKTLWFTDSDYKLVALDLDTGVQTRPYTPAQIEGDTVFFPYQPKVFGDCAWSLDLIKEDVSLVRIDLHTGAMTHYPLLSFADVNPEAAARYHSFQEAYHRADAQTRSAMEPELWQYSSILVEDLLPLYDKGDVILAAEDFAWVMSGDGTLYEVSLADGESRVLQQDLESPPAAAVCSTTGTVALAMGSEIILRTPGLDTSCTITLDTERPGNLRFHEDVLFALCDTGDLLRYDLQGNLLSRTELDVSGSLSSSLFNERQEPTDITWNFTSDGKLVLYAFGVADVIDCATWELRGCAGSCFAYYPQDDAFLRKTDTGMAAMPCYETQELMDLAKQQLGSFTLTPAQKTAYGLE